MIKTSVASVTFREKTIFQIVDLAYRAGLDAIEWGGDIHVPVGNIEAARYASELTREKGLEISAYGSYYFPDSEKKFEPILQTALALKCNVIRVWAGHKSSLSCTPRERDRITEELVRVVEMAKQAGCIIATEYHANTLTDSLDSTLELLDAVPDLRTFWQPPIGSILEENLSALDQLKNKIENLHVYHRDKMGRCRPLHEGEEDWSLYFDSLSSNGKRHYATLEFVMDNNEKQFFQDALLLNTLL